MFREIRTVVVINSDTVLTVLTVFMFTPRWLFTPPWPSPVATLHHQLKSLCFWIFIPGRSLPPPCWTTNLSSFWLPVPQSTLLSVLFIFNICLDFPVYQPQSHSSSKWTSCHFNHRETSCGLLFAYHQLEPAWPSFCSHVASWKPWNWTSAGHSLLINCILLIKKTSLH